MTDEVDMEDDSVAAAQAAANSNRHSDKLSDLGQLCLKTDVSQRFGTLGCGM